MEHSRNLTELQGKQPRLAFAKPNFDGVAFMESTERSFWEAAFEVLHGKEDI